MTSSEAGASDQYGFPVGFFDRSDASADETFYRPPRLVTHIDDQAIAAVGNLYEQLKINGGVLDLMSSWVSHFVKPPRELTALGMNQAELDANPMATTAVVHDLNVEPTVPFGDDAFDAVTCCVSVDYLVHPVEVFREIGRVLRPGGLFVCTFSNRCFPTKAIKGWLQSSDKAHCAIVARYFELCRAFEEPTVEVVIPAGQGRDPLYSVWARGLD